MHRLALLLSLCACHPDGKESGDTGSPPEIPTDIDEGALVAALQDLSDPSMLGRLTGAPSGETATTYVLDSLQSSGWTPITQDVPLPIWEVGSPIDLALVDEGGAPTRSFAYITEYREVLFSGSGDVTADLVFVGRGGADDFAAVDVAGRVVAVLTSGSYQSAWLRALEAGAAAVLYLPVGSTMETYDAWYGDIWQPNLFGTGSPVDPADLHDLPALQVRRAAIDDLLGRSIDDLEADDTPYDPGLRVHLELHGTAYAETTCQNVFVVSEGTDPDVGHEVLLVGAHYDHIGCGGDGRVFFGASDNASGTAAVLELARAFGPVAGLSDRTVVLAFWCGEEQGIYGSYHYTDVDPLWPLADTPLVVNLDNIADPPGPYLIRMDETEIQEQFLAPSADDPIQEQVLEFQCGSDECPFWKEDVSFLRYMGWGSRGHTVEDTFENADLEGLARATREVFRGVAAVGWEATGD